MTIRARLYTAIVVAVCGLSLVVGVAIWGMSRLSDGVDRVERSADDRALALQLKFDVTDFNGWQTAYGYDNGKSRPQYLAATTRFESNLTKARVELRRPREVAVLDHIEDAAGDFFRLDETAWAALQAGREAEVRRILLGPEIENFQRAARAAQELAALEDARAGAEEGRLEDTRKDVLRLMIGAGVLAAFLVVILLVTATDLVRRAERAAAQEASKRSRRA